MRLFALSFACILTILSAAAAEASISAFTTSGNFTVPAGVTSIDVMAIGGGGAGSGSHWTAGGSGYLNVDTFAVVPGTTYAITVGSGGLSDGVYGNSSIGGNGGTSSFGALLTALGGTGGGYISYKPNSGYGGSGGGGAGNSGLGGAGGSGGSNGVNGQSYPGGVGQGSSEWLQLGIFSDAVLSAGLGGAPSNGTHQGGGGGGGVLINLAGIMGGDAVASNHIGGKGGQGYGAGGASSGYLNGVYGYGGSGADGVVVVEWSGTEAVPEPLSVMVWIGLACAGVAVNRRTFSRS